MRRRSFGAFVALTLVLGLAGHVPGHADDLSVTGQFNPAFSPNGEFDAAPPASIADSMKYPPAVSVGVMPDGRVIYWGGLEGLEDSKFPIAANAGAAYKKSRVRVLDVSDGVDANTFWQASGDQEFGGTGRHDMFCADVRFTPDGKVISVGGTIWNTEVAIGDGDSLPAGPTELYGSNHASEFDPATNTWTQKATMGYGRWYPGLVTLSDGKLFVGGGVGKLLANTTGFNVNQTEVYDTTTNLWTDNGLSGETPLPLYPRFHLMPDGHVLYAANGQMWGPFGQTLDQAMFGFVKDWDPATNSWRMHTSGTNIGARSGAVSVMLPLELDESGSASKATILQAGGTLGSPPGSFLATPLSEEITYDAATGTATAALTGNTVNPRWFSSSVLLPTGDVLALNGADKDEVVLAGGDMPIKQAEIYDADAKTWSAAATAGRARVYHNSAVLLPDATVLVGGHSPVNTGYGGHGGPNPVTGEPMNDYNFYHKTLGTTQNFKDPSFEIYEPPYLHTGTARPSIVSVDKGIGYGSTFELSTSGDVEKVVLMRMPSTTHTTDADMRSLELPFDGTSVTAPASGNLAPPGYYYVFAVSSAGVPSKAAVVKVGAADGTDVGPLDFGA